MTDIPTIHKTFWNVSCGKKFVETFRVENKSKTSKVYEVKEVKKSNSYEYFDNRIQIHPSKTTILPRKGVRFSITYYSNIENTINNFYYDVFSCNKIVTHLTIHAKSVGPCISVLTHHVRFFNCQGACKNVKFLELFNSGTCEARFSFDEDEYNQMIEFSPWTGVIPPCSKINLKITFTPTEPGFFYKKIFCLVQYHEPILFIITGIFKPKLKTDGRSLTFCYPDEPKEDNNYESYMAKYENKNFPGDAKLNWPRCRGIIEPIPENNKSKVLIEENWIIHSPASKRSSETSMAYSIKDVFLMNSFIDVKNCGEVPKATALANLSKSEYYSYQWDHDPQNTFQIDPCKGVIGPSEKIVFTVFFNPLVPDRMFHIEMNLKIFISTKNKDLNFSHNVYLPLTKSLRIIGHSFPDDSCGWIPQCKLTPKVLHLPSCVPNEIVYGTLTLERQGHLPVSFEIHVSKASNFKIQPSLGFLTQDFQVFVVQFSGKDTEPGTYQEKVKIFFNNSTKNYCSVKLIVSVEIPLLYLGTNNYFSFQPSFPGTKSKTKFPIENPTNLLISYSFQIPEDVNWFDIPQPKGEIEPMSSLFIDAVFQPQLPCEYFDYVPCIVASVSMPEFTKVMSLQLIGSCQYGYLVATPSIYDFGECNYKQRKAVVIHLFNFSAVLLHFKLTIINTSFYTSDASKDVKIAPSKGSVPAKKSIKITVEVCPPDQEKFDYTVLCQNLEIDSDSPYPAEEPREIFCFTVTGVLPAFKIIDVNVDGGGPLFSPHWVWKMMNINKINKELKLLKSEETIPVKLPDATVNSKAIKIALLLEANTFGSISCNMLKRSLCNCHDSVISYEAKNEYDCAHEKFVHVTPKKFVLEPNKRIIIQIIINYNNVGEYNSEWTMEFCYKRKVSLRVEYNCLNNDSFCGASMFEVPQYNLKPVFIGDPQPPFQLFWLYNNTKEPTSYLMDRVSLKNDFAVEYKVLDCLNPMGVIPPFSSLPLIFHFKPLKIDLYEADVQLCLKEDKIIKISVTGCGIPYFQQVHEFSNEATIPSKPILFNASVALELSTQYINIRYLKTYSVTRRVLFLINRSKTETWAFNWHFFKINRVLKAWVEPRVGIVKPQKEMVVFLVVQSYNQASYVNISIPCDVINDSKRRMYDKAVNFDKFIKNATKDNFTITERGISFEAPETIIPPEPELYHLFLTVNTNIVGIYQLDQKLLIGQQLTLQADTIFNTKLNTAKFNYNSPIMPSLQLLYEKLIWHILCGNIFKERIKLLERENNFCYLQLKDEVKNKTEEKISAFPPKLSKNCIQKVLESLILTNLTKDYFVKNKKKLPDSI